MKKILIPLLIAALILCCISAGAEGNVLQFDKNINMVFEGETLQTVLTRAGAPAGGELSYTSANERVLTVDENGLVTGVTKGRANVTATVVVDGRTYRASLVVTVARKAASVEVRTDKLVVLDAADPLIADLLKEEDEMTSGLQVLVVPLKKQVTLPVKILPADATNIRSVLTSGDDGILKVQGNVLTGKSVGETVLTVANQLSPEINVRYRVLVVQPVTRIVPDISSPAVKIGGQAALTAEVQPENASIQQVSWTSGDERLATVSESGVVTGVKRGRVRMIASALDGSAIRANINVKVVQQAEEIVLDHDELTVDVGRSGVLKATVLPKDTDNKRVVWTSSDESIATVKQGRITGVSLGSCEIICASEDSGDIQAKATVTVQQPVTKITFNAVPLLFAGDTGKITWTVEPANASNPAVTLKSANPSVLQVDQDGTLTALKGGDAYVDAFSTDGSGRRARVLVKVYEHVHGVHMYRKNAYIDIGETARTAAVVEPASAYNKNVYWEISNESVAVINKSNQQQVWITGRSYGSTTLIGTTEDGGYRAFLTVHVGDWDDALKFSEAVRGPKGDIFIILSNKCEKDITQVTLEIEFFKGKKPAPVNTKDGSNKIQAVYSRTISSGRKSIDYSDPGTYNKYWKFSDYNKSGEVEYDRFVARIVSYQIEHDWIKTIRTNHRPQKEWKLKVY